MSFLPKDYEVPQSGNYMKFIQGKNRFRVLAPAIIGNEFWRTKTGADGKTREPVRRRMQEPILSHEIEINPKDGKPETIKHFWAFPVWNYASKSVQILEVTQKTIMQAIQALADEPDWGDPMNYDLIVSKSGTGFDTEYSTQPAPAKPLSAEIETARDATPVDLEMLFSNDDPFVAAPNNRTNTQPASLKAPVGNGMDKAVIMAARAKAWDEFRAPLDGQTTEEITPAWRELLARAIPGKSAKYFTAAEWQKVRLSIGEPVGAGVLDGPGIPEDEIPFSPNVM